MQPQNAKTVPTSALAIAIIVAVLLQLAISPQISLWGGTINFMVVITAVLAICVEPGTAVYIGFFMGLIYDFTSSVPAGLMTLLLTIMAYVASTAAQGETPGLNMESMRSIIISVLLVNLVNGLCLYLIGTESSLLYALGVHALVSSVLDILVAIPFIWAVGSTVQTRGFTARGNASKTYATPRTRSSHSSGKRKRGSRSGGTRYKL